MFYFLDLALADEKSIETMLRAFAERASRQGVLYVEFTGGTDEKFIKTIEKIEAETGLVIRLNQSFNRTRDLQAIDDRWQKFSARPASKYVVGIDFLDNEGTSPALEKGQILYAKAFLDGRFRRTMHAGELGDPRNVRDAMILGVERIGHGVLLAKDPVALEYAVRNREPIEINIASNLRLTEVLDVEHHPFLRYLRLGLPVSLSTDDEGIFDTDINSECELAVSRTDVQYSEMKRMSYNSISTAFASEADKKRILEMLDGRFADFERQWKVLKPTLH